MSHRVGRPRWLMGLGLLCAACTSAPAVEGPRSAARALRPVLHEGDVCARAGREEEAVAAYARAVEADRTSVPAHLRYVSTLVALGRRSEARSLYAARAARADATQAERTMAQRLGTDGSSSALRRIYTLAAESAPTTVWWRLALAEVEIAEAEAWNRRRVEAIDRGDRAGERKAFAQARAALGRAEKALERAEGMAERVAETDLYRGYLRAVEGDLMAGAVARTAAYRAAGAAFARAVERDRELVEAWEGLGDVRLRTGDVRGSLEAFVEAARLAPADPRLRESVGVVLHRIGRHREAREQYREAATLAPRDPGPRLRLGDAFAEDERWEEALAAYDEALRVDASAVEALYMQATVYEHLGRRGEARAAYERYLSQGGERSALVRRRVERLLRAEGEGRP